MVQSNPERMTIRISPSLRKSLQSYADERSITQADAIRFILLDHFEEAPLRDRQRRESEFRRARIDEYNHIVLSNLMYKLIPDSRQAIQKTFAEVMQENHRYLMEE